jgi:hypothetical protein
MCSSNFMNNFKYRADMEAVGGSASDLNKKKGPSRGPADNRTRDLPPTQTGALSSELRHSLSYTQFVFSFRPPKTWIRIHQKECIRIPILRIRIRNTG